MSVIRCYTLFFVWLRTVSNPSGINRFRSHFGKGIIENVYLVENSLVGADEAPLEHLLLTVGILYWVTNMENLRAHPSFNSHIQLINKWLCS